MLCRDFIKISPGYVARRIYLMRGFMCLTFLQYCVDRSSWTSRLSLLNSFHMSYLKQARDTASGQFTQQNPRSACTYRDHIWHRSLGAFFFFFFFLIKRYISESAWSVVPHKVFSIFTRCAFNRSPSYFSFKNHGKVSRGTLERIKKKHFDRKTRRQVFVVLVRLRGLMGVQLHGGVCLQRMCGMWMA